MDLDRWKELNPHHCMLKELARTITDSFYSLPGQLWGWQWWSLLLRKWPHRRPGQPTDQAPFHVFEADGLGLSKTPSLAGIGSECTLERHSCRHDQGWQEKKRQNKKRITHPCLITHADGKSAHLNRVEDVYSEVLWTNEIGLGGGRGREDKPLHQSLMWWNSAPYTVL